jgi:hypothetical protein
MALTQWRGLGGFSGRSCQKKEAKPHQKRYILAV